MEKIKGSLLLSLRCLLFRRRHCPPTETAFAKLLFPERFLSRLLLRTVSAVSPAQRCGRHVAQVTIRDLHGQIPVGELVVRHEPFLNVVAALLRIATDI